MSIDIQHRPEDFRFTTLIDGYECRLEYRLEDGVMVIDHTYVPTAVGGRGIAAELVRFALAAARERGWKVEAECSYAARYLERHPGEA